MRGPRHSHKLLNMGGTNPSRNGLQSRCAIQHSAILVVYFPSTPNHQQRSPSRSRFKSKAIHYASICVERSWHRRSMRRIFLASDQATWTSETKLTSKNRAFDVNRQYTINGCGEILIRLSIKISSWIGPTRSTFRSKYTKEADHPAIFHDLLSIPWHQTPSCRPLLEYVNRGVVIILDKSHMNFTKLINWNVTVC